LGGGGVKAGGVNEGPAGRYDGDGIGGGGLASEEKSRAGEGDDNEGEDPAAWFSRGFGRGDGDGWRVGAFGVIDAKLIGAAGTGVVFGETLAEAARFDADYGIETGIVVAVTIEDFAAEDVLLDLGGFTFQVGVDGELQEAAKAVGLGETGAGQDGLEVLANVGGIAHWIDFTVCEDRAWPPKPFLIEWTSWRRSFRFLPRVKFHYRNWIATLATENERRFAFVAVRAAETDRRMLKTDERMEKLVIAIGKLIAARRQRLDCV